VQSPAVATPKVSNGDCRLIIDLVARLSVRRLIVLAVNGEMLARCTIVDERYEHRELRSRSLSLVSKRERVLSPRLRLTVCRKVSRSSLPTAPALLRQASRKLCPAALLRSRHANREKLASLLRFELPYRPSPRTGADFGEPTASSASTRAFRFRKAGSSVLSEHENTRSRAKQADMSERVH